MQADHTHTDFAIIGWVLNVAYTGLILSGINTRN